MMVLVAYDVATSTPAGSRRLNRVSKLCKKYGQRVQNSIFECLVDPALWTQLKHDLLKLYDPEHDSLRFYFLGANWQKRVEHHGCKQSIDPQGPLIV